MLSASDGFLGLNSPMHFLGLIGHHWKVLVGVEFGGEFGDGLFFMLEETFF